MSRQSYVVNTLGGPTFRGFHRTADLVLRRYGSSPPTAIDDKNEDEYKLKSRR